MTVTSTAMTMEEFLRLSDVEGVRRELIGGELVEDKQFEMGNASWGHEILKSRIHERLVAWKLQAGTGTVFSETMFRLSPGDAYQPDVAVLLETERVLGNSFQTTFAGAPDVAVEIVSSETAERLFHKVRAYLRHGAQAVLVVYPGERCIWGYDPAKTGRMYGSGEAVELPAVLPGFQLIIDDLFAGF